MQVNTMSTEWKQIGTAQDICKRVKKIFSNQLGIDESQIDLRYALREDLGADSADLVEFIIVLAQEFGCDLFDEDVGAVQTVGEMVTYIEQRYSPDQFRL
jgi:acyl carrier protein